MVEKLVYGMVEPLADWMVQYLADSSEHGKDAMKVGSRVP